jgi:hypothetical protein
LELTKDALALVGIKDTEVKWVENHGSDDFDGSRPAIQIGKDEGDMWIWRTKFEMEVDSIKLVGGAKDIRTVEGYALEVLKTEHNYPHEPDWTYTEVVRYERSLVSLLGFMVESLFSTMVENFSQAAEYTIDDEESPWPDGEPINEF